MVNLNLERINSLSPYRLMPTSRPLFYKFVTDFDVNYLTIITRLDHPRFIDITRLFGEAVQIMRKKPE